MNLFIKKYDSINDILKLYMGTKGHNGLTNRSLVYEMVMKKRGS